MLVKIFTREDGVLKGIFRSRSKAVASGLQPLSLVRMEYTASVRTELITIHCLSISYPYSHIPYDFNKQCIALYLQELLVKVLPERSPNLALYDFMTDALILLDDCVRPANMPLWATIEIVRHLGFFPDSGALYDFTNQSKLFNRSNIANQEVCDRLAEMLSLEWSEIESVAMTSQQRSQCIQLLLHFLTHHLEIQCQFKSVEILHEVLNA